MKIFLVLSETTFYQPEFIDDFLNSTKDEIIGAAVVTKTGPKGDIEAYLINHFYYLKPYELIKLGFSVIKNAINPNKKTVRKVLRKHHINFFEVKYSINTPEIIHKIKQLIPDVIVSSNPLIFKEQFLSIPSICCINRHSALLPAYGGLWPVLQAVRAGEMYTGVTIHTMEKEIDKGIILSQKKVETLDKSVSKLYEETFALSASALLEALDKIRNYNFSSIKNSETPSYFSFPTSEHWKEFRKRNKKFI